MKKKIVILLGVFIGFLSLFYGINISQKSSIYISGPEIKNLINIWEDQTGRPPVKKEIDMIIDNLIKEAPDPRWAGELSKLKDLLANQKTPV